jgi:hypothetical protein
MSKELYVYTNDNCYQHQNVKRDRNGYGQFHFKACQGSRQLEPSATGASHPGGASAKRAA